MKHILKLPLGTVPKFEISEERTLDGAPSVVVTFPDGYTDTIRLSRHYANDEDRWVSSTLDTFQDFLIAEHMKPCMHWK